jgi:type II secretory pathway component HofQ
VTPVEVPTFEVETTVSEPEPATEALGTEPWTGDEIEAVIQEATQGSAMESPETAPAATYAAESKSSYLPDFSTKTIQDEQRTYTGRPITLQLVDADVKQVFSLFHEISGLNFVLDPSVGGQVTIVVDDVPWDQALDLILKNNSLDMVLEGNVVRIAPVTKLAQEAASRKALRDANELEAPPVTITRTLSYAKADEVEPIIREAILSPNGRIIVD